MGVDEDGGERPPITAPMIAPVNTTTAVKVKFAQPGGESAMA